MSFEGIILLLFSVVSHVCSECVSDVDLNEVSTWANNLPILKTQDQLKWEQLLATQENDFLISEKEFRQQFYRVLSQPLQTYCDIPKKIGGTWIKRFSSYLEYT